MECVVVGSRSFFIAHTGVHHANPVLGFVVNRPFRETREFFTTIWSDIAAEIPNLGDETLAAISHTLGALAKAVPNTTVAA